MVEPIRRSSSDWTIRTDNFLAKMPANSCLERGSQPVGAEVRPGLKDWNNKRSTFQPFIGGRCFAVPAAISIRSAVVKLPGCAASPIISFKPIGFSKNGGGRLVFSNIERSTLSAAMAKILIVDDDRSLNGVIEEWLASQNHTVECLFEAAEAREYLRAFSYDVIILDWDLPDGTGVEVLTDFRRAGGQTPVLMLTGKRMIEDKEKGLDSGADDYLTKPFDLKELSARLRALLRRLEGNLTDNILVAGHIKLNPEKKEVTSSGRSLKLFKRDFALLEYLMRHPNKVFGSQALLNNVWSADRDVGDETVRQSVRRLRKEIDLEGEPSFIENVHGVGYKLRVL
jgi:DNA-binding response OmpR family regulator